MQKFKDASGRLWNIDLTDQILSTIRTDTRIDLTGFNPFITDGFWGNLISNPALAVGILYLCCKAQCDYRKMTPEDFGRCLVLIGLENGMMALMHATVDNLPKHQRDRFRAELREALQSN